MKVAVVAFALFFALQARAETKPTGTSTDEASKDGSKEVKSSMAAFLTQVIELKKYLVSEKEFRDPKNQVAIASHLKELVKEVKATRHSAMLNQENFKFSRHVLDQHVIDTERVFNQGDKSYARWMMNSTLNICMECHTQTRTENYPFKALQDVTGFRSDFDRAEFLFAIRDFEKANPIYERLIEKYPKSSIDVLSLETALKRQVAYYARVKRDLPAGRALLKGFLKNKNLPKVLQANIKVWMAEFQRWEKLKLPDPVKATTPEILAFAEKNLKVEPPPERLLSSDPRLISDLVISGILFEHLKTHLQADQTADLLYWIAVCDREVNNTFFYSLADLYLRECMTKYPEKPIAAKCFTEYENNTILGYTGSSGTHVPPEVREDLRQLKGVIDRKGKPEMGKSP